MKKGLVLCIGGAVVDRKYQAFGPLEAATSNPVRGTRGFGGVARNVAENLARLGLPVALATCVGDDEAGRDLLANLMTAGVGAECIETVSDETTADYVAVLDEAGDLAIGLAAMAIFDRLDPSFLARHSGSLNAAGLVFADCNLPARTLAALLARKRAEDFRLAVDTVSLAKARRLPADLSGIDLLITNRDEANAVLQSPPGRHLAAEPAAEALLARGAAAVVVTEGPAGAVIRAADIGARIRAVRAEIVEITGAGDALIAGTLYGLLDGAPLDEAVRWGTLLATLTAECAQSVRPDLSPALLETNRHRMTP